MSDTTTESTVPDEYLSDDVQAVAEYRSVSLLAVVAAVLGVASLSAIFSTGLIVIGMVAVIVSLIALRRIATSDGQLVGRTAALTGLALALTVAAGVVVHARVVSGMLSKEASKWGVDWCQLLMDGEIITAAELKNPATMRRPFDDALADYYATNEGAMGQLEKFKENDVVQLLTSAPEGSRVEPVKLLDSRRDVQSGYVVVQEFKLIQPGGEPPVVFRLELRRQKVGKLGGGAWFVSNQGVVK